MSGNRMVVQVAQQGIPAGKIFGSSCDWTGYQKKSGPRTILHEKIPERFYINFRHEKKQKNFQPVHASVCPDPGRSRFPSRSISTSEFDVTRKNRHVPCFDRSQSSAVMAASRAMTRSRAISSLNSSASCWMVARIYGANMTRANVTGIFDMIAMSKILSGPLSASWTMPRALAIRIASASVRCERVRD